MPKPDLTFVQALALLVQFLAVTLAVSLDLSEAHGWMIVIGISVIAASLVIADALVQYGRAIRDGNKFNDVDLGLEDE